MMDSWGRVIMTDGKDVISGRDGPRFDLSSVLRPPLSNDAVRILAFATAYFVAYHYGRLFSHAVASPFWVPDSVLLCALLLTPRATWWVLLLTALPIRLFPGIAEEIPLWFLLGAYAVDAAKALAAAWALRHFLPNVPRIGTLQEFGIFCLIAVLLVPGIFAFGGAALRAILGDDYWTTSGQWFLGDALAQLVITPAILGLIAESGNGLKAFSPTRRLEAAVILAGLLVAAYVAAHTGAKSLMLTEPRFYAPILFLFWAAVRFGMVGASISIAIWAVVFALAAASGGGPFTGASPAETTLSLQTFLFPRVVTIFIVGLSVEQFTRAESLLRESEARFKSVANAAPALIWTSGKDKLCDFVNQGWLDFTGRTMAAELGNGWVESLHPEDAQRCFQTYSSAFEAREPFEMEYRVRRHDGQYRWVLDRGAPRYTPDGEFNGYAGLAIDIVDRKKIEELNNSLAHVQRLSAIGELSAAITHELGQPLSAILLNMTTARRLLNSAHPPLNEIREIVSEIDESLARANHFIRSARTLLSKKKLEIVPTDVYSMTFDMLVLATHEAVKRGVHIRTDLPSGLPPVLGDCTHLQQVLMNLIINAMNAMRDTPASARELMIRCKSGDDRVEFLVVDQGCGITEEKMAGLFDPSRVTKEAGLGLSIARSIVEAHKGRIWAENNSGGGATFHFTLRAAPRDAWQTSA
jgi:PAS domain S-box-containing protein